MNEKVLEYCMRGIIQFLNGDIEKFNRYKDKAMEIYKKEYQFLLEDLIPESTKIKLYEMVS